MHCWVGVYCFFEVSLTGKRKKNEKKRHLCSYLAEFVDLNSQMFSIKRKKQLNNVLCFASY